MLYLDTISADRTPSSIPAALAVLKLGSQSLQAACRLQLQHECNELPTVVQDFAEKPKGEALKAMQVDTTTLGLDAER